MSKFSPTPAEVAIVNQIFIQTGAQKIGVVTGDAAVQIFSGSKLSPTVLAEIWSLADDENNGVLTRKGVAAAIRLLGHAQRGERVTSDLLNKPGPIPTIEGLNAPIGQQSTGVRSLKSPPPPSPGLPPFTPQDKAKFLKLFTGCGPVNGILNGDKARDVFVKSKLPVDKLSQIWNLADTQQRGALDATDFAIAMYLIQATMAGHLQTIPAVLPPLLYDQAGAGSKTNFPSVVTHATGGSVSFNSVNAGGFSSRPISTVQPQYTGQAQFLQTQMTGQTLNSTGPPLPARSNLASSPPTFPFAQLSTQAAPHWDVTQSEKANSDTWFDTLDTQKHGYIEGDVAVPFMLQSNLPEDALAQIWDLADINNDGRLTRDGFAVALHLMQGKLAGKDIPTVLPPSLIPPSMRTNGAAPTHPPVPEAMRDLIWDDTPPSSATVPPPQSQFPPLQAQSTGALSPQHTAITSTPKHANVFGSDPFASSPFAASQAPVPAHKDLLGDDEELSASSSRLHDQSAEIGNVQNQLSSTKRSLDLTKNDRENLERTLQDQAAQLSNLQTQLSSAKAAYETETRLLSTLRERYALQNIEITKAREELIHAESELSALRVEKTEVGGALLRDKDEVRELQRKMAEIGTQVEGLKVDVEKAKKEAKQQKGLLAIAKKQLVSREAERTKVEKELEEAKHEIDEAAAEREQTEAGLASEATLSLTNGHDAPVSTLSEVDIAAAHALPASPEVQTPVVSPSGKSTNPFERLAKSTSPSRSQSPFLPFSTSTVLPTPPTAVDPSLTAAESAVNLDDPFGFSDAFGTEEAPATLMSTLTAVEPPTAPQGDHDPSIPGDDITSPADTDYFSTPLSSAMFPAVSSPGSTEHAVTSFPSLNAAESSSVAMPVAPVLDSQSQKPVEEEHTNLDSQLKEIELDESDSDSDDDNAPLTEIKAKLIQPGSAAQPETTTISAFDDSFGVNATETTVIAPKSTSPTPKPTSPALKPTSPAPKSISPAPSQSPATSSQSPEDAASNAASLFPPTNAQEPISAPLAPAVVEAQSNLNGGSVPVAPAGVTDFDEALGKIPSSKESSQFSQFTFDSAFDDNFDFAAASAASLTVTNALPPPPGAGSTPSSPLHVTSFVQPPPVASSMGFDDVFNTSNATTNHPAAPAAVSFTPPAHAIAPEAKLSLSFDDTFGMAVSGPSGPTYANQPGPSASAHGISFDDAFGGNTSDVLSLDSSFSQPAFSPPPGSPPQQSMTTTFPAASPPRRSNSYRSASPPARAVSPPPRNSSPRLRPSTGSSDKAPSTRHSKLSIRLPFRKKNRHETPPVPPVIPEPVNDPTPSVEDDVDAVKQLCGMGFSRTQAVQALENHGYDVQRALNSLLGQ